MTANPTGTPRRIEFRGIAKTFETPDGGTVHRFRALGGVDIDFRSGFIHAILGENGAGKSTLMHVLSGLVAPSEGTVSIDGEPVAFASPADALRAGIAMVHQRPLLADGLSVLENALVGLPGTRARRAEREALLRTLAGEWELPLDPGMKVAALTPSLRLFAALVSSLFRNPDFLVLDEPTAVLSLEERDRFMAAAKRAAGAGLGVILITHKLDEALRWSDRITVLRHGLVVFDASAPSPEEPVPVSRARLAALLDPVESETAGSLETALNTPGEPGGNLGTEADPSRGARLSVDSLAAAPKNRDPLRGVSFTARPGSVTGVFGVPGGGLKTLEDLLTGMLEGARGTVEIETHGGVVTKLDAARLEPRALRRAGVAIVPSNRTLRGSDPNLSVADVLLSRGLRNLVREPKAEREAVSGLLASAKVDALPSRRAGTLSGGQLQRLILARELASAPSILMLAEPEWGLDIKSAAALRDRLRAAADSGMTVVILTDTPDSMHGEGFYDAVYALREGAVQ